MLASGPVMSKGAFAAFARPQCIPRSTRVHAKQDDVKQDVVNSDSRAKDYAKQEVEKFSTPSTSFATDARASLEPRVQQLRDQQSSGLTQREEIFDFRGPLPELVNGRLAMLGFTACLAAEYFSHQTVFEQIKTSPILIAFTFITFFLASLIPILRGAPDVFPPPQAEGDFKSGFTVTNELINGRAAMIGFAIIIAYETFAGRPIFA